MEIFETYIPMDRRQTLAHDVPSQGSAMELEQALAVAVGV
jgi:hypothetical protein